MECTDCSQLIDVVRQALHSCSDLVVLSPPLDDDCILSYFQNACEEIVKPMTMEHTPVNKSSSDLTDFSLPTVLSDKSSVGCTLPIWFIVFVAIVMTIFTAFIALLYVLCQAYTRHATHPDTHGVISRSTRTGTSVTATTPRVVFKSDQFQNGPEPIRTDEESISFPNLDAVSNRNIQRSHSTTPLVGELQSTRMYQNEAEQRLMDSSYTQSEVEDDGSMHQDNLGTCIAVASASMHNDGDNHSTTYQDNPSIDNTLNDSPDAQNEIEIATETNISANIQPDLSATSSAGSDGGVGYRNNASYGAPHPRVHGVADSLPTSDESTYHGADTIVPVRSLDTYESMPTSSDMTGPSLTVWQEIPARIERALRHNVQGFTQYELRNGHLLITVRGTSVGRARADVRRATGMGDDDYLVHLIYP